MAYTDFLTYNQYFDLVLILGSMVLILALWKTAICLPFKLLIVFIHELGHASMALVCCGKVTSLTVQANESGLTNYTYTKECVRFWVTPAGYIGSSVVGFALIVASATIIGALASAGCIAAIMIVSLFFQKNWIPRLITIGVVLVVAVLFILHFVGVDPNAIGTRISALFIGVNSSLYSIWDIIDDNVTRDVSGSDSVVCASLLGCPNSGKTVGIVWLLISLVLFIIAIIIHLYLISPFF